jgi:acetoacetyl-CoA synthetase
MNTAAQVRPMGSSASAPRFWRHFLSWAELHWEGSAARVTDADGVAVFPDLRLNYAENLLLGSGAGPDAIAITSCHADGGRERLTRAELQARVEQMAEVLREQGVGVGDRVVAILRNDADAAVTALAVAAIGASLTIAASEAAASETVERFAALAPRLLIAHVAALPHDTGEPLTARVLQVAAALASLDLLITLGPTPLRPMRGPAVRALPALLEGHRADEFHWQRFAFEQPLFAQASSRSAGGLLIEHVRQHRLEYKLRADDKLFFHVSCASAAWHWQLSALATGCEIVLYDGPMTDAVAMRRIVQNERVKLFGPHPPGLTRREGVALE